MSQELRALVYARDNWQCQGCGVAVKGMDWRSVQHRQARGVGGRNSAENLIVLCGSATSPGCHLRCENRDADMIARGFVVWSWQDPAEVPVELWDGRRILLDDQGGWAFAA